MSRGLTVLFVVVFIFVVSSAEEVSKFRYLLKPESLNNKTIQLSSEKVAMAEFIAAGDSSSNTIQAGVASVFFIIDNSASMYNTQWSDIMGERFTVVNALIDSFNTFNPEIEVGVAVFQDNLLYNPDDDQIIEDASGHAYGFVPLLKLGDTYQSTVLGNATGYQILKHYMEHTPYSGGIYPATLKYKNPNVDPKGTNINSGFSAAKQAFSNASYVPESQFIMFLSDGLQEGGTNEYIQGENTPTTFTVYMSTSKQWPIPEELVTMTENIKTNGYSNTNSKSQIHMIEKGENEILAWTLDNVLTTIFDLYEFVPQKITVNGISNSIWQNGGFDFGALFPLTGKDTPFKFEIDYKYYLNDVYKGDTTHIIDFIAQVIPGAIEENIETKKWGRDLEIYNNGTLISDITPEMDELEVRFSPYKVDTTYGYDNVEVEIYTSNANSDKEIFTLTKSGSFFTHTFNRESGNATIGDNILQLKGGDNLIAVFRNKELPLDTLEIELTSSAPDEAFLTNAIYYDNNADGHVDSLYLELSGVDLDSDIDAIINNISLPAYRNFNIDSYNKNGNGIGLKVTEGISDIYTYTTADDKVNVKNDIELPSGAPFNKNNVTIIDSIAPVLLSASLVDSVKVGASDYLTVEFSENVLNINSSNPFVFYAMPVNSEYDVELSKESQNKVDAMFRVISIAGASSINDGDSVNINWQLSNKLSDEKSNKQDNLKNRKVPVSVTVIEEGIMISEASYFDENADGFIDKILIGIKGEFINENLDNIINAITLPSIRKLAVDNYSYSNDIISLSVSQNINIDEINTAVSNNDLLTVAKTNLPQNDMVLLESNILIKDKMAPVIISASLVDSIKVGATDYLNVQFSESIEGINTNMPFYLYAMPLNSKYEVEMDLESQNGFNARFEIVNVNGVAQINESDSIHINWEISNSIADNTTNSNVQKNPLNRKVDIEKTVIADAIILQDAAYFDNNADGFIDLITINIDMKNVEPNDVEKIVNAINFPLKRKLEIIRFESTSFGLNIFVDQLIDESSINTSVSHDEVAVVNNSVILNDKATLTFSAVTIKDSMAPVILSGLLIDSLSEKSEDQLNVTFSENVSISQLEEPIAFYSYGRDRYYSVKLKKKSLQDNHCSFKIEDIETDFKISSNDSIRINWVYDQNIYDMQNINQSNSLNRAVELDVVEIPDIYKLIIKSTLLNDNTKLVLNDNIWQLDGLQEILSKHETSTNTVKGLSIITLTPDDTSKVTDFDSLSGDIAIFDAVGNEVISKKELTFDKENNQLIFLWDGKNNHERKVGAGLYVALVNYSLYYKQKLTLKQAVKNSLGVHY